MNLLDNSQEKLMLGNLFKGGLHKPYLSWHLTKRALNLRTTQIST